MIAYVALAFLAGGFFGIVGMAILAYGPKMKLYKENSVLCQRLDFLENEAEKKRFKPIKDPRKEVHTLVG